MRVIASKQQIEIANVAQRDLYRKYGAPARPGMVERLQMFKEEFDN